MKAYLKKMFAAGIAGVFNWVPTYPADVVKSIIQTSNTPKPPRMIDVIKEGYRVNGTRFFFLGVTSCALMAFPTNCLVLVLYDYFSGLKKQSAYE